MSAFYVVRPLGAWLDSETPRNKRRSRWTFKASWSDTVDLLERELRHLKARDVVLQLDVQEKDLRIDGMLRANASPNHPGVRISFDSIHGPLTYATDSCDFWQHNVRSIALGLEALRAVDRYGVTKHGEQYTGWKAIGAGPGTGIAVGGMTRDQAREILLAQSSWENHRDWAGWDDPHATAKLLRSARFNAHPDRNDGDHTQWNEVEQAAKVLGLLS